MLPLHSSGICACTYHVLYNASSVEFLIALQALLTTVGNTTLAFATYRLAVANGWTGQRELPSWLAAALLSDSDQEGGGGGGGGVVESAVVPVLEGLPAAAKSWLADGLLLEEATSDEPAIGTEVGGASTVSVVERASSSSSPSSSSSSSPLAGFEDLGDNLAQETDFGFVGKLFVLSAAASYAVKYGELLFPFTRGLVTSIEGGAANDAAAAAAAASSESSAVGVALALIFVPTALNMAKWASRSADPKSSAFGMF